MKALDRLTTSNYIQIIALSNDGVGSFSMLGSQVSPRGICALCTNEQITSLHASDTTEAQPKFQALLINLELGFSSGEIVELETQVQVQSIRRISQTEFEVYMGFTNMVQDGYRHIARYMADLESQLTE